MYSTNSGSTLDSTCKCMHIIPLVFAALLQSEGSLCSLDSNNTCIKRYNNVLIIMYFTCYLILYLSGRALRGRLPSSNFSGFRWTLSPSLLKYVVTIVPPFLSIAFMAAFEARLTSILILAVNESAPYETETGKGVGGRRQEGREWDYREKEQRKRKMEE